MILGSLHCRKWAHRFRKSQYKTLLEDFYCACAKFCYSVSLWVTCQKFWNNKWIKICVYFYFNIFMLRRRILQRKRKFRRPLSSMCSLWLWEKLLAKVTLCYEHFSLNYELKIPTTANCYLIVCGRENLFNQRVFNEFWTSDYIDYMWCVIRIQNHHWCLKINRLMKRVL